ncbi:MULTISPECIES: sulfite reductase subunit alpha [Pseudomonas]|uniref:sulfite reductase subunit alpha n=1 Tax=Pseudomonas TaxID=286 RepID=UPI000C109692|nr:sulfite reductase [Pseudomonadaceae bacterium]HCP55099.1 sulfite reductase [Pseudomonas sp.]
MIAHSILRRWPVPVSLLLAAALLWLQPAREISALLICLVYVALCAQCAWQHRRARPEASNADTLLVAYASQSGQAQQIAERSCAQLIESQVAAQCLPLNQINLEQLSAAQRLLLVVSTYGEGEAPDNAVRFEHELFAKTSSLANLQFAILALGDSQYAQFCALGERLQQRLQARGAEPLFDLLKVDNLDPGTLRHWQQQLAHLSANSDFVDWQPAHYRPWQLVRRTCLNPGSSAAPIHHLSLQGADSAEWQAGDIVEIGPRHSAEHVAEYLQGLGMAADTPLDDGQSLAEVLSRHHLPAPGQHLLEGGVEQLIDNLKPLAHREYSIASSHAQGHIDLLVREQRQADGRLGLGSGWLCRHADLGEWIDLRIRRNPGFHGPAPEVPMILLGSGSGLAGLLAHLHERAAGARSRNWLIMGERERAHDALFDETLTGWQRSGHLERLDRVFSRDGERLRYVQDALRENAETLEYWLNQGAAIYVCGSLEKLGRGVDSCLRELLGPERLSQLSLSGRYRRDLY